MSWILEQLKQNHAIAKVTFLPQPHGNLQLTSLCRSFASFLQIHNKTSGPEHQINSRTDQTNYALPAQEFSF